MATEALAAVLLPFADSKHHKALVDRLLQATCVTRRSRGRAVYTAIPIMRGTELRLPIKASSLFDATGRVRSETSRDISEALHIVAGTEHF